jgi:hypothetical protein
MSGQTSLDAERLREELAALRPDELEALVGALAAAEHDVPTERLQPSPDSGADFVVERPGQTEVFVVNQRLPPFPSLRASLERVIKRTRPQRVVVATTQEVDDTTRRRLSMIVGNYVDTWDLPVLVELLAKHSEVEKRFFVPPEVPPTNPLQRFVLWLAEREEEKARPMPGWLRLALLSAVVGLAVASPLHMTQGQATWVGILVLLVVGLAIGSTGVTWKDIGDRIVTASRPLSAAAFAGGLGPLRIQLTLRFQRVSVPPARMVALVFSILVLRGLRSIGLALTGIGFFAAWTATYLALWGVDPGACAVATAAKCDAAFAGFGKDPTVGDFAYFATSIAFFAPPSDLQAVSRTAHALQTAEMVMAAGLLASFATQLGLIARRTRKTRTNEDK